MVTYEQPRHRPLHLLSGPAQPVGPGEGLKNSIPLELASRMVKAAGEILGHRQKDLEEIRRRVEEDGEALEENLKQAEIVYGRNPDDPDATIWLGRRIAYLGRYRDAISACMSKTSLTSVSNGCCQRVVPVDTSTSSGLTRTRRRCSPPCSHRTVPVRR